MKFIDLIKLYCKEPKQIRYGIRDFKNKTQRKFFKKLKRMVYDWENKTFYNINITDHYKNNAYQEYYFYDKTVTFARLNPVIVVMRELDIYFEHLGRLEIQNLEVDTQNEELITVIIHTKRPGFIIGKGGSTMDYFTKRLTELFGKKTQINIIEIKNDINEPIYIGY